MEEPEAAGAGTVVAAIADDPTMAAVLETARHVAALYAASVLAVHVGEVTPSIADATRSAGVELLVLAGEHVGQLTRLVEKPTAAALVLGAGGNGRAMSDTLRTLITTLSKAVVVVSPDTARTHTLERILVPLDGTPENANALEAITELATRRGIGVVIAHVHQPAAVPAFTDHLAHEVQAWSAEFLARNCPPGLDATLELGVGEPHKLMLDILRQRECDLVALGWNQDLSGGRAGVVQHLLAESPVPVLLTPCIQA